MNSIHTEVQQRKLLLMGLYLLIWGEAANLRFMPECLCYIYHHSLKIVSCVSIIYTDNKPPAKDPWVGKVNFVEIRSYWHIFRSFDRMWCFFILCLQGSSSLGLGVVIFIKCNLCFPAIESVEWSCSIVLSALQKSSFAGCYLTATAVFRA
ncbi:hypothetical protein R6Q59_014731 [Mikania micrantha]